MAGELYEGGYAVRLLAVRTEERVNDGSTARQK